MSSSSFVFYTIDKLSVVRPKVSNVTANHMNSVLGSVLKLINKNLDAIEAPWMKRIAGKTFCLRRDFPEKNNCFV